MGFEHCHPAVNFIYLSCVIAGMIIFQHPIFLAISFLCAFLYSVKRNGRKALVFNCILLLLTVPFALYYSTFNHFGVTVLRQNFVGNNLTLESLVYGFVLAIAVFGVCIWLSCLYSIITTDKVVYLFGKISPLISLFLSVILRMVPRIKKEAKKINMAQRGIGRGIDQGNIFQRFRNCIRIFSILITWLIESLTTVSESIRSRGGLLRGRKAFSIYRFDNRDRAYVIGVFTGLTVVLMAVMLKQTDILYNPRIIMTPITPMSYVFYIAYAIFCLMPLGLELWTEYRFRKARESVEISGN